MQMYLCSRTLSIKFLQQNPVTNVHYAPQPAHMCHMPCASLPPWFHHPNNIWWGTQAKKQTQTFVLNKWVDNLEEKVWLQLLSSAALFSLIYTQDITFYGDCECQHCVLSPNVPHKFHHNSTSVIQVSPYSSIYSNLHLKWHACVG